MSPRGSLPFPSSDTRIISKVAGACSLFDDDGLEIRFLNSDKQGNGIRSEADAQHFVSKVKFSGVTPLGTSLDKKILQPMLLRPAQSRSLKKPLLVVIITDGAPYPEPRDTRVYPPFVADSSCESYPKRP